MLDAKITLSERELSLVRDADIILTKNAIIQKAFLLLQEVQDVLHQKAHNHYRDHPLFLTNPKISRGENYLGLPYLILDYPRVFKQDQIFAIRSFFWWGHFFSSTLHIDGVYKQEAAPKLAAAHRLLSQEGYFVNTGTDAWAHHFEEDNYTPVQSLLPGELASLAQRALPIKIAARWPLEHWPVAAEKLIESWELLMQIAA